MGGRLGRTPSQAVLDQLPIPAGTPSTTLGRTVLRAEATAVLNAIALAHTPATDDSLADLHAAWKLLHDLDEWTLDPKYGPGTDLRTPLHRLLDRIAALHPDTAAPLAATRDHLDAARIRAAAHAYLRHVLPLWPDTADWTDRARTAYLEEHHALRTATGEPPPGPPQTQTQTVLRAALTPPSPNPRRFPVMRPRPCGAATPAGAPSKPAGTQPSRPTAWTTSPAPTPPREHHGRRAKPSQRPSKPSPLSPTTTTST
ncbi:hypothetical protein ACPF8X_29980 [Streptomyces sp. G35A]